MSRDWLDDGPASDDWLDEPEARYVGVIEAAENERRVAAEAQIADAKSTALVAFVRTDVELPVDEKKQSDLLMECWNGLGQQKQVYLKLLRENNFNVRKTVRLLAGTPDSVSRAAARNWTHDADFAFVLKVMTTTEVGDVVKKERLLLRANEIAEEALEPRPILHKGRATGYYETKPDIALRANEQLMKTQKMLGNDDAPTGGYSGPALIIQVVQRDGSVIDMSPRGVTVDLPAPDGT